MNKDFVIINKVLKKYKGSDKIVTIPKKIKTIDKNAFKNNPFIERIILPEGCNKILDNAFSDCINLTEINLENIKIIGEKSFRNCEKLNNINIKNIEEINYLAFENTGIKTLSLPNSFKKSTYGIFSNCKKLEEVEINSNLYGRGTFDSCDNLKKIKFTNNKERLTGINIYIGNAKNLEKIETNNPNYVIKNGIIYNNTEDVIICCPPGLKIKEYEIQTKICMLENFCFAYNENIEKIIINKQNVLYYGSKPFYKSKIKLFDYEKTKYTTFELSDLIYNTNNDNIEIILPKVAKNLYLTSENDLLKKINITITFKNKIEEINPDLLDAIKRYNFCKINYKKTLEELIEEGKTFKEASTIIKEQER